MVHEENGSEKNRCNGQGILYLCATPIGNLEDITIRVLRTLRTVDCIAAEDTRVTRKILAKYNIQNKLISYNEHNRKTKEPIIVDLLKEGKCIALTSDAGTPGISDPGAGLVSAAIRAGIRVESLPGPAAFLVALTGSGFNTDSFVFAGFLPRRKQKREELIRDLKSQRRTIIIYEAPHRLLQMLHEIKTLMGDRQVALCRELTKKFEEVIRGPVSELIEAVKDKPARGEYTVIIEGAGDDQVQHGALGTKINSAEEIKDMLKHYLCQGLSKKDAVREVAEKSSLKKKEIYALSLELPENDG